jgi:hypothetical protein
MASWGSLTEYVSRVYRVAEQHEGMLKMIFDVGDLRSQIVFLWRESLFDGEEEWVQIESPFGNINQVDLAAAIRRAGEMVCGGVAVIDDTLTYRHSVPLDNMDVNEFERPLLLVTAGADRLEHEFTGGDNY